MAKLGQARTDAKAGKPRPRFYIAVALALGGNALRLYHGLDPDPGVGPDAGPVAGEGV